MPLAHEARCITNILQHLGNGDFLARHAIRGFHLKHVRNPHPARIPAGKERRPCRAAHAVTRVEISKNQPALAQCINIGCRNIRGAKSANIPIAEIISENDHNIGFIGQRVCRTPHKCKRSKPARQTEPEVFEHISPQKIVQRSQGMSALYE